MRISHVIIAGIVSTGFAYLAGYGMDKYTDHEHKGYSAEQVAQVDKLVKPGPMKLVHPKNRKEWADQVESLWGLKKGNYEIGGLQ